MNYSYLDKYALRFLEFLDSSLTLMNGKAERVGDKECSLSQRSPFPRTTLPSTATPFELMQMHSLTGPGLWDVLTSSLSTLLGGKPLKDSPSPNWEGAHPWALVAFSPYREGHMLKGDRALSSSKRSRVRSLLPRFKEGFL